MTRVLQINSSLFGHDGVSSQLADDFVAQRRAHAPDLEHVHRDLAAEPVPHLTSAAFQAALTPVAERDAEQRQQAALADRLIEELEWADELVLGLPMYNFGVPSPLKAWFDHVARAGRTFRYTSTGPEGLLEGKRARVFAARGGVHDASSDNQIPHVRNFLGLLGFETVDVVTAEGLQMGGDHRREALETAERGKARLLAAA